MIKVFGQGLRGQEGSIIWYWDVILVLTNYLVGLSSVFSLSK